jgi:trans-aconitate methyltransferase
MPHLKMRGGVSVHHSGCGPLGVLDLLSDRVGIAGEVVGLDNEPRMIALAERGLGNVDCSRRMPTPATFPPTRLTSRTSAWSSTT